MNKCRIYVYFFFVLLALAPAVSYPQMRKKTHKLKNKNLSEYVVKNRLSITAIRFKKAGDTGLELFFIPAGKTKKAYSGTRYDMNYMGHIYQVNKTYGQFPVGELIHILESLKPKKAVNSWFEGTIDSAGIILTCESYFPRNDQDWIYTKVPIEAYFKGGEKKLSAYLSDTPSKFSFMELPPDSVMFFRILIKTDSTVESAEPLATGYGKAGEIVARLLNESRGWVPALQSGWPVKSYKEIFIRFDANKKVEADYIY